MSRVPLHLLGLLCLFRLGPVALAEPMPSGEASDPTALFVPEDRVPLSEFVKKTGFTATMHVEPTILNWIANNGGSVRVAIKKANGQIVMPLATSVVGDTVMIAGTVTGKCVVVSGSITHALSANETHSIQTHWEYDAVTVPNGTQSFGAKDGIGTLDYSALTGEEIATGTHLEAGGMFYTYRVNEFHLFSDGSGEPEVETAKVPDRERFIAETYALYAPTNLRAVALSDHVRQKTGWPVAHYNAGPPDAVLQDVPSARPVFQVVHCNVVDIVDIGEEDPYLADVGDENSLATFILPPFWSDFVAPGTYPYPVLFNGFYDIHDSTFGETGKGFFEAIGEVYNASGGTDRAVGVLWNGGGASVTTTLHASAFDNAAELFADMATLLKADVDNIVMVGGSRGGTTALAIASNPRGFDYHAAFVDAVAAQVNLDQVFPRPAIDSPGFLNPTYPAALGSVELATGYQNSWKSNWVVKEGEAHAGMSRDDFCRTILFGTTDLGTIRLYHTIDSDEFINGLVNTVVILGLTTHDHGRPFVQMARYVNHLKARNVTVQCNVLYRFGHTWVAGVGPSNAELLQAVFTQTIPTDVQPEGVEVRYWAFDPANPMAAVRLVSPPPLHVPLIVELPMGMGSNQAFTVVVCGEPNAQVRIEHAVVGEPLATLVEGRLSEGLVFGTRVFNLDSDTFFPQTAYWYEAWYEPEGGTVPQFGEGDLARPDDDQPTWNVYSAAELIGEVQSALSRTGGLSGDRPYLPPD